MDDLLASSRFASWLGLRIVSRSDGACRIELPIRDEHANTRGIAHGGVIASLIDTAAGAAIALQPSIDGQGVVTVSLATSYLAPAQVGDVLVAEARRRSGGKRVVVCEVEVTSTKGDAIATALVTLAAAKPV
ncbi:PaaI family thioesterase [Sandaracinus amylolyticus]|uniref:Thioesterase domain-containing protein n=1 Tax=Sandaracinus amylolyticus TaxID=927083 RepID=A0A0F6VZI5_9BACT|nr:PaaI family thioesterase [Sandaracinus amylolyticus]AKF03471.1 hypothetical protein DB32_000620 [Sandaracinus amylolyticus]